MIVREVLKFIVPSSRRFYFAFSLSIRGLLQARGAYLSGTAQRIHIRLNGVARQCAVAAAVDSGQQQPPPPPRPTEAPRTDGRGGRRRGGRFAAARVPPRAAAAAGGGVQVAAAAAVRRVSRRGIGCAVSECGHARRRGLDVEAHARRRPRRLRQQNGDGAAGAAHDSVPGAGLRAAGAARSRRSRAAVPQVQTTNSVPGWSGGGRPPSVAQALGRVARQEGVAVRSTSQCPPPRVPYSRPRAVQALWKGNGVTIVHRLPYSALNFMAYERVMALFCAGQPTTHRSDASPMAVAHRLAAGATAGCLACVATYPLDLVRTRLAAQTTTNVVYTGLRHALRTIVATEGVRGLYRGLGATLVGVAPSLAINFAVYETLRGRAAAAHPHAHPTVLALCAGSAAGAASATICFPLDLVRRRMQLAGAARGGLVAAAKAVAAREGAKGFYRGLVPELAKVVPGVGIAFSVFEGLKRALAIE